MPGNAAQGVWTKAITISDWPGNPAQADLFHVQEAACSHS
jgi:hypothetical protein